MSTMGYYKSYQSYKDEYSKWRNEQDLQYAKGSAYIRQNPDSVELKDI